MLRWLKGQACEVRWRCVLVFFVFVLCTHGDVCGIFKKFLKKIYNTYCIYLIRKCCRYLQHGPVVISQYCGPICNLTDLDS